MGKTDWRITATGQTPAEGMLECDVEKLFSTLKPLAALSKKSFCGREISFNENLEYVADAFVDEIFVSPIMQGSLGLHMVLTDEFFPIVEIIVADIFDQFIKFNVHNPRVSIGRNFWI